MTPIATYTERLLHVRRTFTLFPDRILVRAHWLLGGDYQRNIPLSSLHPDFKRIFIRYKWFKYSALMLAVGVVFIAFTIYPTIPSPLPAITYLGIALAAVGLPFSLLTYRRIPFVCFRTRQQEPGIDIASAGPDKPNFDAFIDLVQKQIRKHGSST